VLFSPLLGNLVEESLLGTCYLVSKHKSKPRFTMLWKPYGKAN
jgi:hypothetical protein